MYKGFDLSNKVAVLTGSTAGMGLAIARGLAQCGAKVVVSSNTQEETNHGAQLLVREGHSAKGVRCDILSRNDIERFSEEAKRAFGRADVLFCLAAEPAPLGSVMNSDLAALDSMLLSTVSNNLALIRRFIPDMAERRDGSIVV
ncbi:MAG TPA: SDR family NAD(P)-dependent oxidoreductase, partial [Bradyrhizobium sp.]|nr:SDR family NAD(P)-dependent oxidoreductase [Bradyrhizobium sp.]